MKTFWTIFITVIVMAGLGAGGYYYLNSKQTKEKNDLQAQIDDLNEKLSAAQTTSTNSSISSNTTSEISQKQEACRQLFPNDTFTEADSLAGLRIGTTYCTVDELSGNYARGGENTIVDSSGGPGSAWLAQKLDGTWTKISQSQDVWDCPILRQYSVPSSILASPAVCYNATTQKEETYSHD